MNYTQLVAEIQSYTENTFQTTDIDTFIQRVKAQCQLGFGFIIDDGSYAYAIVSASGLPCLIDPHVDEGIKNLELVPLLDDFLRSKRGLMILEVPPISLS